MTADLLKIWRFMYLNRFITYERFYRDIIINLWHTKKLIEALKQQIVAQKEIAEHFYIFGREGYEDFEDQWEFWISSMPEDIEKRKRG